MIDDETPWWANARCHGAAPKSQDEEDIFYPPRDKQKYKEIAAKAKVYCFGETGKNPCPVRLDCLWDAVGRSEPHGIWGGLSHRERNALERKYKKDKKSRKTTLTLEEYIFAQER